MAAGVYMVDSIFERLFQFWLALISLVCWIDVVLWFHKIVLLSLLLMMHFSSGDTWFTKCCPLFSCSCL